MLGCETNAVLVLRRGLQASPRKMRHLHVHGPVRGLNALHLTGKHPALLVPNPQAEGRALAKDDPGELVRIALATENFQTEARTIFLHLKRAEAHIQGARLQKPAHEVAGLFGTMIVHGADHHLDHLMFNFKRLGGAFRETQTQQIRPMFNLPPPRAKTRAQQGPG